jgi:dihydrofolate synthase/folylpolyglutamate synthase
MTYEQALAFWYGRINYEQKTPQAGDFKLDRMRTLMRMLGNPQDRLRIVHVAGSKGKGSTSAMLASILRRAGYRTGLFTSPHLVRVEERIQVDEQSVTAEELGTVLDQVRAVVEAARLEPTFFEVATALGFLHFVRRRVDVAVVEVGLGGRLDSTNVCEPLVSVITSISHDHTQMLGSKLASIAAEKAGIVKPGRPVVSGASGPEVRDVIERTCLERRAPLFRLGDEFRYHYEPGHVTAETTELARVRVEMVGNRRLGDQYSVLSTEYPVSSNEHAAPGAQHLVLSTEYRVHGTQDTRLSTRYSVLGTQYSVLRSSASHLRSAASTVFELGLLGEHQAANAAVAVAVVELLRAQQLHISEDAVRTGLATVEWPARLEVVGRRPFVVLDCAHNVASAVALVRTLETSFPPARRWLLFAGSSDKDLAGMFRVLAPRFHHAVLTSYRSGTRSMPPDQLAGILGSVAELPYTISPTAADAWRTVRERAGTADMICITGSVFLAGELRPLLVAPNVPA